MNNIVGMKRSIVAFVLLVFTFLLFSLDSFILSPDLSKIQRLDRNTSSEISKLRRNLNGVENDFKQLDEQQEIFNKLDEKQFFNAALLVQSQRVFEEAQSYADVKTEIVILKTKEIDYERLNRIGRQLLMQQIDIKISAYDDVAIYNYIDYLNKNLPGYIKIRSFNISRLNRYSMDLLRSLMQGVQLDMLSSNLSFHWYFILDPEEQAGE